MKASILALALCALTPMVAAAANPVTKTVTEYLTLLKSTTKTIAVTSCAKTKAVPQKTLTVISVTTTTVCPKKGAALAAE
ncbi:hypothetical protein BDK51DRAFT_43757, partial [Blyttiomyces helicus]